MQSAEIELKFPVADVQQLRAAAAELGFTLLTERTFESNTLYDTPDRQLRARKQILRLRRYGDLWTVTHKRQQDAESPQAPSGDEPSSRYKTRIETESVVQDGPALATIFQQLGYSPVFRYEKFRTEWESGGGHSDTGSGHPDLGSGHLVLDETPIGVWAELEGPPVWIDAMLDRLGVAESQCTIDSYGTLFLKWREAHASPARNLTFEETAAIAETSAIAAV